MTDKKTKEDTFLELLMKSATETENLRRDLQDARDFIRRLKQKLHNHQQPEEQGTCILPDPKPVDDEKLEYVPDNEMDEGVAEEATQKAEEEEEEEEEEPDKQFDWVVLATDAISSSALSDITKQQVIKEWEMSAGCVRTNPDLGVLWARLTEYLCEVKMESTRLKKYGQLKSVTKRLGLKENAEFELAYARLRKKVEYEQSYKQLDVGELKKKLQCSDGSYLNITKLEQWVEKKAQDDSLSIIELHRAMCLALFVYHGLRPQDYICLFKQDPGELSMDELKRELSGSTQKISTIGYYNNSTSQLNLFSGKTNKGKKLRQITLDPRAASIIDLFHKRLNYTCAWLVPSLQNQKSKTLGCDALRKLIQRNIFCKGNKDGFPINITPTDLRHLYETHIRYCLKLDDAELDKRMVDIGHSNKTSLALYSELYRGIY